MIVNISDYGKMDDENYIVYDVLGLSQNQMDYLHANLAEETSIEGEVLHLKMYFFS